uniref:Uncharacterized protein n=1 Tax=Ananas comosus var. bracteatus TaxID=296719 RepID=A0A6V7P352_ANACO|nr:unnamed protein product [Ananas comosus var. bracteatus]
MAESERTEALKRAYADVLVNTAREAAARVAASERRAAGLRRSAAAAKEDALATMLRLKAIMDSKLKEAEIQTSGHVRRIQQLEVQLHEAEDTIKSLQTELKRTNGELEHVKKNLADSSIRENGNARPSFDNVNCRENNQTTVSNGVCFSSGSQLDTEINGPDLVSAMMRSKVRMGRTQRVRAFGQNFPKDNSKPTILLDKGKPVHKSCSYNCSDISSGDNCAAIYEKIMPDKNVSCRNTEICANAPFEKESIGLFQCTRGRAKRPSITKQSQLDSEKAAGHSSGFVVSEGIQNISTNSLPKENLKSNCREKSEKAALPMSESEPMDENTIECHGTSVQAESVRFLKYTFQRKRKRESLDSNAESVIPDNQSDLKRMVDERNCEVKSQKTSLIVDSPRSDRRLMQVARQLISLSSKRW